MKDGVIGRAARGYLRSRAPAAGFLLLCGAALWAICWMLGAPPAGVLYGLAVCAFLGLCACVPDFARYLRRHAELEHALGTPLSLADALPEPRGLIERDYDALLRRLMLLRAGERDDMARARREQSEYYALWAHQIKVPISAMKLLLRDRPDGAALGAELLRVEQYVDMALGYERLSSPGADYVLRACEVDPVIRQVARRFAPLFIQKKLKLDLRPTGMTALTDEKWLAFALEQLLSNAVKYTRAGGVVCVRAGDAPLTLVVEDTGIGVAKEDIPRVFERGYTGYNGRADKRATGLGLYLTKRALDKLGHTVSLESQPGRGTRVTVGLAAPEGRALDD